MPSGSLITRYHSKCHLLQRGKTKFHIFQGKFPNSAYWFHQMYYGTNHAFRRSRTGSCAVTFTSSIFRITMTNFTMATMLILMTILIRPMMLITRSQLDFLLPSDLSPWFHGSKHLPLGPQHISRSTQARYSTNYSTLYCLSCPKVFKNTRPPPGDLS